LVHPAICDECGNDHERKGNDYHPYSSLGWIAHQEIVRAQTRTSIRIKAGVEHIEPPMKSQGAGGPTNLILSA